MGTGGSVGGKTISFDFRITQYTTDEELQSFAQLVKDKGTDALRRALEKEDKGRISAVGSTGNQIAVARSRQQGSETTITIVTARTMPFVELYRGGRTTDYPFGYLQGKLDGAGKGTGWKGTTPDGIKKVFPSETQFSLAVIRTQLFNPNDMDNVKKIQAGYKVQTLSDFTHQPPPASLPAPDFPKFTDDAFKLQFPVYLNFLLQFCPTPPEETALRARFATVGIEAGKPFDLAKLSDVQKGELGLAVKEGYEAIEKQKDSIGKDINGWNVGAAFGNRAFYNGNYLLRAGSALAGIYGNDAIEAMYPQAKAASDGQPLDASKHNYTLTFAAGQFPPVNAFWSVTMYDGKTQLLIRNPINRYLINSPMLPILKKNADGSLALYIQKDVPAGDKKANWLPAPDGPIYMVMRLYWPKAEPPSILPPGVGTWQPPAIQVAQ